MTISTTIADHSTTVPSGTSAAHVITNGVLAEATKNAIKLTLNESDSEYEYGAVTAVDAETETRHTTKATKGYREGVAPAGVPKSIIDAQSSQNIEAMDEPSAAMTGKYAYEDLIAVHTHPVSEAERTGSVGLSANDIRDDVFAGDHISAKRKGYDIYRAKAAVVFTNDTSKLPIPNTNSEVESPTNPEETNWLTADHSYPEETLLNSRPKHRPWLHLVERNHTGSQMTEEDTDEINRETLRDVHSEYPSARFMDAKCRINHMISELLIPLSP